MTSTLHPIDRLVHELSKLPTIGEKTALRLALHLLREPPEYGQRLARAMQDTIGQVRFCDECQNITTEKLCSICKNTERDSHTICVVEDIADLQAIEKSHSYKGKYHILHGALSPLDGMGPDQLKIKELEARLKNSTEIHEIILATNPNVNGDATALYLARLIKRYNIPTTKLASGLPVGGHIEYLDHCTLSRALEGRLAY